MFENIVERCGGGNGGCDWKLCRQVLLKDILPNII